MLFCTISCADHLHLAINMAKSVKEHHPNSKVILCLVEKSIHPQLLSHNDFDKVILVEQLCIPGWSDQIKKYNRYEASISIRGHFYEYLLENFPSENKFIYLDPDTKVYSFFTEIEDFLDSSNLILTPHLLLPAPKNKISEYELHYLQFGVFNLGFFGFKRSIEASEYIHFLKNRLTHYCFVDLKRGLYADQKWIDAAPCFFNVHILKHPGYNVAIWNFHERAFSRDSNGNILVNNLPIRFIHFSQLIKDIPTERFNIFGNSQPLIASLQKEYIKQLERLGKNTFEKIPWSYK